MAKLALPIIMSRSKSVIQQFIADDLRSGHFPLPRLRLDEVVLLLSLLRQLNLHSDLELDHAFCEKIKRIGQNESRKRHLLLLLPLFCDCITVHEQSIKFTLKEILHDVAKDIGLE